MKIWIREIGLDLDIFVVRVTEVVVGVGCVIGVGTVVRGLGRVSEVRVAQPAALHFPDDEGRADGGGVPRGASKGLCSLSIAPTRSEGAVGTMWRRGVTIRNMYAGSIAFWKGELRPCRNSDGRGRRRERLAMTRERRVTSTGSLGLWLRGWGI